MAKEYKLSAERLAELEQELNWLKTVREKEVAELIKEARSFGDLSENSEYDEAKNEQSKMYGRMAEVENILAHAVVIEEEEATEANKNVIGLGCKVKVRDLEFDEIEEYEIVGAQEADPGAGRISDDSPLGRSIIGRKTGDTVEFEAPVGVLKYEIVEVSR